ncbi:MFS transporter [Gordonibacter sp. Marseille-P4307]|uniref:MFS transporter n=1 Tax=Gordonibacter sp. Marseille-P4307 TaxID=2161815 RepID=UPI000F531D76|nr:MFS transporter [Gordonibacter sp. Marseille-P4307]
MGNVKRRMGDRQTVMLASIWITVIWLAADMYLPALPTLVAEFNTTEAVINSTMMANTLSLAFGSLLGGPLTDKVGRRAPLLIAAVLVIVANAACACATSPDQLIALRIFAGSAGGLIISTVMAVLRDRFNADKLASAVTVSQSFAVLGPLVAPFLGSLLLTFASWRGIYILLAILSAACFLWTLALEETLPLDQRADISIVGSLGLVFDIARDRSFMLVLGALCMAPLTFGTYLLTCSYVYLQFFSLDYIGYSICYFIAILIELAAPFIYERLSRKVSPLAIMITIGGLLALAGGLVIAVGTTSPVAFLFGCAFFIIASGMGRAFAYVVLMGSCKRNAGAASALITFSLNLFAGFGAPIASIPLWPNHVIGTGAPSLFAGIMLLAITFILVGPVGSKILDKMPKAHGESS